MWVIFSYLCYYFWITLTVVKGAQFECPLECLCRASDTSTTCTNQGFTDLPSGIYAEVVYLDLSFNEFSNIPRNISYYKFLEHLNFSHNHIARLDADALKDLSVLKVLDLSGNDFINWVDIHYEALTRVPALLELNLSHNKLQGFPDVVDHPPLKSTSLETLTLINCSITNVLGDILLDMPQVRKLILADNRLTALNTQIKSDKLQILDFTDCNLQRIHPDSFVELPSLEVLLVSRNYQLKKFNSRSNSLRFLDLSHCNLESVPSSGMSNLTKISLKGNHLRRIPANSFRFFPALLSLDLSNNAIEQVDVKAFQGLKAIQKIDLSYNTMSSIAFETFMSNTKLHTLNLSRNYLRKVGQLVIESIKWLDMSVCEIREISRDSLIMMPKLEVLNLSRNLLSSIPNRIQSDELRVLDISSCGIYSVNNSTFAALYRLKKLNIAGNRLTSGIKPTFFYEVTDLQLRDNSWYCDCESGDFRELYQYLFNINSASNLRCRSPESVAGLTWEVACQDLWYGTESTATDTMWVYSLSLVILMTFLCCVVISIRHIYHRKAVREREVQEQEREEARERLRQMHQRSLQQSRESVNRNAPDPRELQTPPSYAEAISMSRLNISCSSLAGSHRSLHSLHSSQPDVSRRTKLRRKRRRSRQDNSKSYNITETQSAASLSHANTDISSSEEETRRIRDDRRVMESNF